MSKVLSSRAAIEKAVTRMLRKQPIVDLHTHLYPPSFGTPAANKTGKVDRDGLMLWGLDELLTYHYLIAEVYRVVPATVLPYAVFWKMTKREQADHIWKHLFVERTPISEACRGVLTSLEMLGLEVGQKKDLSKVRKWFSQQDPDKYIDRVMELSNVESITMTNGVFDDNERKRWLQNPASLRSDPRFKAVLRIDPMLRDWKQAAEKISAWGYAVGNGLVISPNNIEEAKRFLREWIDRQAAIYCALSLGPDWRYPVSADRNTGGTPVPFLGQMALEKMILPVLAERGMPFAMMIGSVRQANAALKDAGDSLANSDVSSVARLCAAFPENKFLVTMLARENQHELCVTARKFGNLMIFGCWWFLNNPSLIEEITRMRVELLGTSMIPQHSDSRILDQLLYKWEHSRRIIGKVLVDKYADLVETKWVLTETDVENDVNRLMRGNFTEFLKR
jgi:hypothetical protein